MFLFQVDSTWFLLVIYVASWICWTVVMFVVIAVVVVAAVVAVASVCSSEPKVPVDRWHQLWSVLDIVGSREGCEELIDDWRCDGSWFDHSFEMLRGYLAINYAGERIQFFNQYMVDMLKLAWGRFHYASGIESVCFIFFEYSGFSSSSSSSSFSPSFFYSSFNALDNIWMRRMLKHRGDHLCRTYPRTWTLMELQQRHEWRMLSQQKMRSRCYLQYQLFLSPPPASKLFIPTLNCG